MREPSPQYGRCHDEPRLDPAGVTSGRRKTKPPLQKARPCGQISHEQEGKATAYTIVRGVLVLAIRAAPAGTVEIEANRRLIHSSSAVGKTLS